MMMKSAMTAPSAGLLTRTSLQLVGVTTEPSAERIAKVLRRVPGVLLAEVDATSGRITIAHDEAVALTSLLACIQSAGFHARNAAAGTSGVEDADAAQRGEVLRRGRLMTIALGTFVAIVLLSALVPNGTHKQWLLLSFTLFAWSLLYFYFVDSHVGRTRS